MTVTRDQLAAAKIEFAAARTWHTMAQALVDRVANSPDSIPDSYEQWYVEMHEVACHNAHESFKAAMRVAHGERLAADELQLVRAPEPPGLWDQAAEAD